MTSYMSSYMTSYMTSCMSSYMTPLKEKSQPSPPKRLSMAPIFPILFTPFLVCLNSLFIACDKVEITLILRLADMRTQEHFVNATAKRDESGW